MLKAPFLPLPTNRGISQEQTTSDTPNLFLRLFYSECNHRAKKREIFPLSYFMGIGAWSPRTPHPEIKNAQCFCLRSPCPTVWSKYLNRRYPLSLKASSTLEVICKSSVYRMSAQHLESINSSVSPTTTFASM